MFTSTLQNIHTAATQNVGMDVLIVSTPTKQQAHFWEAKLQKAPYLKEAVLVFCVHEDWEGGAGNGFGTFYAFLQANQRCQTTYGVSLFSLLEQGQSIALYHTAGHGKRLAPLSLVENNNKPAVHLPAFHQDVHALSLLELVVKQTAIFASPSRFFVFWSDQIFLPSEPMSAPTSDVELFVKKIPMPAESNYHHLSSYGLATMRGELLNKLTYKELLTLQHKGWIDLSSGLAINMGSFSLSSRQLHFFCDYYAKALEGKRGQLDTDNDLWMPYTLQDDTFYFLKKRAKPFVPTICSLSLIDTGKETLWWDFGTNCSFYTNLLKMTQLSGEGTWLRELLCPNTPLNEGSLVVGSDLEGCTVESSVLFGVKAKGFHFKDTVAIGGNYREGTAKSSLLYNVDASNTYFFEQVCADSYQGGPRRSFQLPMGEDAKEVWNKKLGNNPCSFEEQFILNSADESSHTFT